MFPREGMGFKTDFIFCEKVSLTKVIGKKDGCLTEWSSGAKLGNAAQGIKTVLLGNLKLCQRKENGQIVTISLPLKSFPTLGH